jgi:hypothetical protein
MMLHDLEHIEGRDEDEEDGERERQDEGKDREWRSWVEDKPTQCLSRLVRIVISIPRGLHSKR